MKNPADIVPGQRARWACRDVNPRSDDRCGQIMPDSASRAQEAQEPSQRTALIRDGRSRQSIEHAVDERVDVGDARGGDRAIPRSEECEELHCDVDVASQRPDCDSAVSAPILGVFVEQRRQSSLRQARAPTRHRYPQGLQRAGPCVQAVTHRRATHRRQAAPMASADDRRCKLDDPCQRQVTQLVDATREPVRSPSTDPTQVRRDRPDAEPARSPRRDHRLLPRITRHPCRKSSHAQRTRFEPLRWTRLCGAISSASRRERAELSG